MNKYDFIDWNLTQQKFDYKSQKLQKTDPVIVLCSACSSPIEVRYDSVRNRRGKPYNPICRSCKQKKTWRETDLKDKISTKISIKMQEVWNNDGYLENQRKKHSEISKEKWKDPTYAKQVSFSVKKAHRDSPGYTESATSAMHTEKASKRREAVLKVKRKCSKYKRKLSEAAKKNWENPKYRERMLAIFTSEELVVAQIASHNTPEYLEHASQAAKILWSTDEYVIKTLSAIKDLWDNGDYRTKMHDILTSEEFRSKQIESHSTDEYLTKASQTIKLLWQNDEYRTKALAAIRAFWNDPEYRRRQIESHGTEKYKERCSTIVKALWEDPEYRKSHVDASKEQWSNPEYREAMIAASRALWENPEYRKIITESSKEQWNDPQYRETISASTKALWENPEYRRIITESSKEQWNDPQYSETISASTKALWEDPEYRRKQIELHDTEEYKEKMAAIRAAQPRISSIQRQLYQYLADLGVDFVEECVDTKIGHYVFDCLVPKQGGMYKNLLVECQGDYWHSLPRAKSNDRSKFTYIDRYFPEYEIMYVWEHEFYAKDRVLQRLQLKLGVGVESIDFDFKDVSIRRVVSSDIKSFLDAYHYIGKGRGGECFGAFLDGELTACIVFSPPIRQKMKNVPDGDVVELSRLCIHPSYHKKNFASWFVSASVKLVGKPVIAFADTTVGHAGTVYKASNFVLIHEVPPDYWYVDVGGYVMHKKTLYQRAVKMKLTESEFANRYGYFKKWGGKKLAFLRTI